MRQLAAAIITASVVISVSATTAIAGQADQRSVQLEFVAFSENSQEYLVKVVDADIGPVLQVRSTKKNKLIKAYPYDLEREKAMIKRIRRKHKLVQDPVDDATNPRKGYVMMTRDMGDKLGIYMMRDEKIRLYDELELLKDDDDKPARANQKQLVWDQRGKYAVIIYSQKLEGAYGFSGDFLHAFKFKSYKASFAEPEGAPGTAPPPQ